MATAPMNPNSPAGMDPDDLEAAMLEQRQREIAMMLLKDLQGGVKMQDSGKILAKMPMKAVLMNSAAQGFAQSDIARADRNQAGRQKASQEEFLRGVEGFNSSPDKNQAIAQLMASKNPMLRAMAAEQAKIAREQAEKEAARRAEAAKEAAKLRGEFGDLAGAETTLRDTNINPNRPVPSPRAPEFTEQITSDGKKLPSVTNYDLRGKATGAFGPAGTNVTVQNDLRQANAATEAFGKESPKVLREAREGAQKAIQGLESSERILDILKDPAVMTGSFAEPRLFVAKVGDLLGFRGPEGIGQTQSLMSELASQTLAQVRRLPGAITEKERPFLEMAAAGKLDYTPEAMRRLAEIAQVAAHNELMDLVGQYDSTAALPGVGENAKMFPFPRGWKFKPNPETMEPQGKDSDRWRMKPTALGQPGPRPAPGAKLAPVKPLGQMTVEQKLEEIARLERELGMK